LTSRKPCFVVDTRRDFVYVDDIVEAVMMALRGRGTRGYYHLSSGKDFAIKELFEATLKALDLPPNTPVELRPRSEDDVFTILLDPSKTTRDFQWSPRTKLEDGIKKAVEWYRTHGLSQTFTHLKIAKGEKV